MVHFWCILKITTTKNSQKFTVRHCLKNDGKRPIIGVNISKGFWLPVELPRALALRSDDFIHATLTK